MKRICQLSFLLIALLAYSGNSFAQKNIKEGYVVYSVDMESNDKSEMAMMAGTTLSFYFSSNKEKMVLNMMSGLMNWQTFTSIDNSIETTIFMDIGLKIQLTGIDKEDASKINNFMNTGNIAEIEYDEKNKKEIAGFDCYKAIVKTKDGQMMQYYITEKITPPSTKENTGVILKGFPLERTVDTGQGVPITLVATEVSNKIEDDVFEFPTGYKKMTMEEFEKSKGGAGGFGN